MHHLLRDAAHVNTCATEAPLSALGSGRDKVSNCDPLASIGRTDGTRKATATSANDKDVVVVLWLRLLIHLHSSSLDHGRDLN